MTKRTVALYMNADPISINENSSMEEVMREMRNKNLSHIFLLNNQHQLTGIISRKDLLEKTQKLLSASSGKTFANLEMGAIRAVDIMSTNIISLNKSDSIEYAIELLLQKAFHCLPVVEDGRLIGLITFYDLLKTYYQEHG